MGAARASHRGPYRSRGITKRQMQVLEARFQHGSRKAAAAALGISEATVRGHMTRLCELLGVETVFQAAYVLWLRDLWGDP
mgnify:CR=1 FL=1